MSDQTFGDFIYGPVIPPDEHEHRYYGPSIEPDEDEDGPEYATYGELGAPEPPVPGTGYHLFGDPGLVYGDPTGTDIDPFDVEPEDARAVIIEVFPRRVNHVCNSAFQHTINAGPSTWRTTGTVAQVETDSPYSPTGLEMSPEAVATYGSMANTNTGIYVSPTSPQGTSGGDVPWEQVMVNLWKFAFVTNAHDYVYGALLVTRTDGTTDLVRTSVEPRAFPWDEVDATTGNSGSGWYCVYDVLDLGHDVVWAWPVVGVTAEASEAAIITSVIVERWDSVDLLEGPAVHLRLYDESRTGDAAPDVPPPWSWDWTDTDLLSYDHLIYFDGEDVYAPDFVWLGKTPATSTSGYYPQRISRTNGLRTLMRSWVPIGRSVSIRRVYDRPTVLTPVTPPDPPPPPPPPPPPTGSPWGPEFGPEYG